eukprot:SAG11_NODE_1629_length_4547_cov_2.310701_1_plen_63_part_10
MRKAIDIVVPSTESLTLDDAALMVRDSGGLVSPTDEHDCEGSGPRPMLEGREVREGTPEAGLR